MSVRSHHPTGAPCWVETLQPEPRAAARFYGGLLGWEFEEAHDPTTRFGEARLTARIEGRRVAGIRQSLDASSAAVWSMHIRVGSVEEARRRVIGAGGRIAINPAEDSVDGRLALVADDEGNPFGVWEARGRGGAELVNEPGAWAMSSLHTRDQARAEAFYGSVFGWRLEAEPAGAFSMWRLPGYVGEEHGQPIPGDVVAVVAPIREDTPVPPHWAVNFRVADVDRTAERVLSLGGDILVPPMDTPGMRNAVIADPAGGVIAISAQT